MYATIIVPLDGTPAAERALPDAAEIARRFDARIVLVQVIALPEPLTREWHGHGGPTSHVCAYPHERLEHERATAVAHLDRLITNYGVDGIATPQVQTGDPVRRIRELARASVDPLIVMTGSLARGTDLSSGVAERLIRDGDVPILTVPAAHHATDGGRVAHGTGSPARSMRAGQPPAIMLGSLPA